ncbi:MAG TPA: DUF3857 domain-containing protein, partial [Blastocatellia bacterium]|nr:DUF3857 domain-containing protein [Blastocatellia bacterium]
DWKPIDPAHLAMKSPVVEKDADAEAIFWEVRINDSAQDLVFNHYIRIKVFTERGKESQSKIDIPYLGRHQIKDIAGRTIKPDGTVVELKKDAIFDRTIVKVSGLKLKSKSFAMPSVEPGAIIEYRWREVRPYELANYLRLHFQRDIPVQLVKYYIKPASLEAAYRSIGMSAITLHGNPSPFVKEKDGYYSTQMVNMPAFREEPRMPPEDEVRTWMLVYYSRDNPLPPEKYWPKVGKEYYEMLKDGIKVNDEVKRAAADAIGDAATPEQKLERLFNYCRTRIKNVSDDASGMTASERSKLKDNNTPADTLKRGMGSSGDITKLFAALAAAAGFEARLALVSDRGDIFFNPQITNSYFLSTYHVAVRVGDGWRFFDPGMTYVPYGMLRWQEEGQQVLIADPRNPVFVKTPLSSHEKSMEKRTARLKLLEDGTLEGEVRIEYTGHLAVDYKETNDDDSPEQREQNLRDMIKGRMSTAELSDIRIENVTDPVKPFAYVFKVRIPGYAQRTGKRLFLQPAFFQRGKRPLFSTSERKHAIYFHYPWSELDKVYIELPDGYALDNPDAPAPFSITGVGKYEVKIQSFDDGRAIELSRSFFFGGGGAIFFNPDVYPNLKKIFDMLHERDNHTITLKQVASNQQR